MTDDLVAAAPTATMQAGLRVLDFGIAAGDAARNGDWIGASLSGVGAGVEAAAFIIDPIGELLASGAAFLMEHLHPLPAMLDSLAGSPGEIDAFAQTWTAVAERLENVADSYSAAQRSAGGDWSGSTAAQYQCFGDTLADTLRGTAASCQGTAGALAVASGIVAAVRAIVRDLIADLVAKLIKWVAQIACTAGLGASWVIPDACVAVAEWVAHIGRWLKDLVASIGRLGNLVTEVSGGLKGIGGAIDDVVLRFRTAPVLTDAGLATWSSGSGIPAGLGVFGAGANAINQREQAEGNRQ